MSNRYLDLECKTIDVFDDDSESEHDNYNGNGDNDDDDRVYEIVEPAKTVTAEIVFHRATNGDSWERTLEIELPLSQALQLDTHTRVRVKPIAVLARSRRGHLSTIDE